jgi:hypothetical protein
VRRLERETRLELATRTLAIREGVSGQIRIRDRLSPAYLALI